MIGNQLAWPNRRKPGPGWKIDFSKKPASDIVADWSFAHASLFSRTSGLGGALTLHGYATTDSKFVPGFFGNTALKTVAASSQYADIATLGLTGPWTIIAWAKAATLTAQMTLIANSNAGFTNYQYYLAVNANGSIECGIVGQVGGSTTAFTDTAAGVVTAGAFHQIAATSDGTGNATGAFKIYFDGKSQSLTDSGTGGTIPPTGSCGLTAIGVFGDAHTSPWDGVIDNILVMDVALTAKEIWAFYQRPFLHIPTKLPILGQQHASQTIITPFSDDWEKYATLAEY